MELKWIEPQSRFLMKTLFGRNFDAFTESARLRTNWAVLGGDAVSLYIVLSIFF